MELPVPPADGNLQTTINWLFGVLIGIVAAIGGYILNLYRGKVDDLEAKVAKHESQFMSREELSDYFDKIIAERQQMTQAMTEERRLMHNENLSRFDTLSSGIRDVHNRVDQLFDGRGR